VFRTLLVEDNLQYRAMVKELLLQRFPQLEIQVAGNRDQALRLADSFDPDLIFMDVRLPGCNGLDLTAAIKASHARAVVVVLTSHDLPEYRNAVQRFAADYFLSKNASLEIVFELVEDIISDKALR